MQDSTQKRIYPWPLQEEKFTINMNRPTDFYVLDGIRMKNNNSLPKNIEIVQVLKIKDPDELRRMGVIESNKSFTFYNTESNDIYVEIVEKVKHQIPFTLWGMRFPILINKKLIMSYDFTQLSKIDQKHIEKITFLPKSSPFISTNKSVVYGAIQLQIKE
jgi:hypothetical protein